MIPVTEDPIVPVVEDLVERLRQAVSPDGFEVALVAEVAFRVGVEYPGYAARLASLAEPFGPGERAVLDAWVAANPLPEGD